MSGCGLALPPLPSSAGPLPSFPLLCGSRWGQSRDGQCLKRTSPPALTWHHGGRQQSLTPCLSARRFRQHHNNCSLFVPARGTRCSSTISPALSLRRAGARVEPWGGEVCPWPLSPGPCRPLLQISRVGSLPAWILPPPLLRVLRAKERPGSPAGDNEAATVLITTTPPPCLPLSGALPAAGG